MDGLAAFLAMGGYGGFVWPAYALAALLLAGLGWWALRSLRAERRAVQALEADAPHRRRAAAAGGAP